jgi:hypothetical protein
VGALVGRRMALAWLVDRLSWVHMAGGRLRFREVRRGHWPRQHPHWSLNSSRERVEV